MSNDVVSDLKRYVLSVHASFCGDHEPELAERDDGFIVLHADIVKIFEWMVEYQVGFDAKSIDWLDNGWRTKPVPDGDYLAAIVGLMGGEE